METLVSPLANMPANPDPAFWRGKRVALTGHTGFKGAWLAWLLQRLGAEVYGLALPPHTMPNLYEALRLEPAIDSTFADIRDAEHVFDWMHAVEPHVVLHLAAQALVRPAYADPVGTYATNVMGTVHVLEAVRHVKGVQVVLCVTTDKVYRNREDGRAYRESDELGGHDPYSASKAACELAIASYRSAFLQTCAVASARAGNVIGGGDWSQDRLLPDAVKAWQSGQVLQVRRPDAVRPWQHVLEPLTAYLLLVERLVSEPAMAAAYNFGPSANAAVTVRTAIESARAVYGVGETEFAQTMDGPHEAGLLHLDTSLAKTHLGIASRWNVNEAIARSMNWYRCFSEGEDAQSLCEADWLAYETARSGT